MKLETKDKLDTHYKYCLENNKSIEFTIEYLQDTCRVSFDCVVIYLTKIGRLS